MMSLRAVSALLLLIGIVVGTAIDTEPSAAVRVGNDWLLAADFHVHAFTGDGSLSPWSLRREAARRGIDVFAITNHNQTFAARFARWVSQMSSGPLILVGQEITASSYELIAVGIEDTIDPSQSSTSAVLAVQAQGGVAIAPHPVRAFWDSFDDQALAILDGVEAAHPLVHIGDLRQEIETFHRRVRALNHGIAAIGSSDFHASPELGACRTYLLAREFSAPGVIEAVREGRTVAVDRDGNIVGDPTVARIVETTRRRPIASARDEVWRYFAIACTWIGLLGMVVGFRVHDVVSSESV